MGLQDAATAVPAACRTCVVTAALAQHRCWTLAEMAVYRRRLRAEPVDPGQATDAHLYWGKARRGDGDPCLGAARGPKPGGAVPPSAGSERGGWPLGKVSLLRRLAGSILHCVQSRGQGQQNERCWQQALVVGGCLEQSTESEQCRPCQRRQEMVQGAAFIRWISRGPSCARRTVLHATWQP